VCHAILKYQCNDTEKAMISQWPIQMCVCINAILNTILNGYYSVQSIYSNVFYWYMILIYMMMILIPYLMMLYADCCHHLPMMTACWWWLILMMIPSIDMKYITDTCYSMMILWWWYTLLWLLYDTWWHYSNTMTMTVSYRNEM